MAPDTHGRERPVSRLSQSLPRGPGGLQAPLPGGGGSHEGGEASQRPAAEAEDHREPQTFGQCAGRAAESGVRGGVAPPSRGPGDTEEARVLWQIREDPQGRHQPEHDLRRLTG